MTHEMLIVQCQEAWGRGKKREGTGGKHGASEESILTLIANHPFSSCDAQKVL